MKGTRAERALLESQFSAWWLCLFFFHFLFFCLSFFFLILMLVRSVRREPPEGSLSPWPFTRSALSSGRWQLNCWEFQELKLRLSALHSLSPAPHSVLQLCLQSDKHFQVEANQNGIKTPQPNSSSSVQLSHSSHSLKKTISVKSWSPPLGFL